MLPKIVLGLKTVRFHGLPLGGNGNYTYAFNDSATTATMAESLAPGDYVISVTDVDNCVGTDTITVEEATPIAVSTAVTDASCFGEDDGEVVVTAREVQAISIQ